MIATVGWTSCYESGGTNVQLYSVLRPTQPPPKRLRRFASGSDPRIPK